MAQQRVGSAALVRNEVERVRGSAGEALSVGDALFRNEVVRTGADSLAKIVLLDSTNLSVGPRARLTLNEYALSGEGTASRVGVRLVTGAFRFVTGDSDKRAYEISTPTATLGVRGTIFQVFATGSRTIVKLEEGEVTACPRPRGGKPCITLSQPGDVAIITASGVSRGNAASVPTDFAAFCAAEGGLCTRTAYSGNPATFASLSATLCGR